MYQSFTPEHQVPFFPSFRRFFTNNKNILNIVTILLIVVGIGVTVYLTQRQQTNVTRASSSTDAFTVTDSQGKELVHQEGDTYKTESLDVVIQMKDINALLK